MQKNSYNWILSDVNIIICQKTAIIEFYLMLISTDAEKTDITKFCKMLISSDGEKTTTIELYLIKFGLMLISSGAEKPELLKFLWCLYKQM